MEKALEKTTSDLSSMTVEDDNESDRKLLIAVDFGTTFSGVAWAQTRRVQQELPAECSLQANIPHSQTCKQSSYNGLRLPMGALRA